MKQFLRWHLYPCLLTLLASQGAVFFLCLLLDLWFPLWFTLPVVVFFTLLIHFLNQNRKLSLLLILPPVLLFLCMYLLVVHPEFVSFFLEEISLWWISPTRNEFLPAFYPLLLLPILLCLVFVFYLLQKLYYTRALMALVTLTALILLTFFDYDPGKPATVLFLAYFTLVLMETSFRYSLPKKPLTDLSYVLHLWPVTLLLVLLLVLFPYKNTPMEWTFARSVWNNLTETWSRITTSIRFSRSGSPLEFDMNFSGYSDDAALGNSLLSSKDPVLEVLADRPLHLSLYLVGNTKNTYTGSSWENSYTAPDELSEYSEYQLDTAELLYATMRSEREHNYENLYLRANYQITFLDYISRTMFLPQKLYSISSNLKAGTDYAATDTNVLFQTTQSSGTKYRGYCYQLNLGSQELFDFVSKSSYSYDDSSEVSVNTKASQFALGLSSSLVQNTDALFRSRADSIRLAYLSLPSELPERVGALAKELTKDCSSDYEKLLTLEAYLNQFTYTRTPSKAPKGSDFIDYFLFESKEGYCTYFASALAILGRCIDIPTRYVQGYCLGAEPGNKQYIIYSSNAHAWTEAYLEGFGWIPLDATPGYTDLRYLPWHYAEKELEAPETTPYLPTAIPEPDNLTVTPAEPAPGNINTRFLPIFLLIPLMLIVLLSLYLLRKLALLKRFYRKSQPADRYFIEISRLLDLLSRLSYQPEQSETLQQFFARVAAGCPEQKEQLETVCNSFMAARYGNHPLALPCCEQLSALIATFEQLLKTRRGKRSLFYYRIALLIHFQIPD